MIKKVSELEGAALDWAVAKAQGWITYTSDSVECGDYWHTNPESASFGPRILAADYYPSRDWAQGGPIIEQERLNILDCSGKFSAYYSGGQTVGQRWYGATPLIAAMRCYVASKLGNEVEIPIETKEH